MLSRIDIHWYGLAFLIVPIRNGWIKASAPREVRVVHLEWEEDLVSHLLSEVPACDFSIISSSKSKPVLEYENADPGSAQRRLFRQGFPKAWGCLRRESNARICPQEAFPQCG